MGSETEKHWGREYWEYDYRPTGPGLEPGAIGPRDPRRDGVLGVWKGIDSLEMNKCHGKLMSLVAGLVGTVKPLNDLGPQLLATDQFC